MRPIDADAFKEYLQKNTEENADSIPERLVDAVLDVMDGIMLDIDEQPTIDAVPRWIPCEDRLPENSNTVLITKKCTYSDDTIICFGWYIGDNHWGRILDKEPKVIAWMPLPEPYEGEGEDDEKNS